MIPSTRTNYGPAKKMLFESGPELPFCQACGSAEYLVFEEYVPSRIMPEEGPSLPEANYSCLQCGQFNSHKMPAGWEPPGWFWYA